MFGIGMPEMILILAVALIVIGPKKLPDLAKSLGRAMGEFKKATNELKDSMQIDSELKDLKSTFNDLEKEDQAATKRAAAGADKADTVDKAQNQSDDGQPSPDTPKDPLDSFKTAFQPNEQDKADADAPDSATGDRSRGSGEKRANGSAGQTAPAHKQPGS